MLSRLAEQRPDWRPRTLLDVGAGPGIASWAAAAVWPGLERVTCVEVEPAMIRLGRAIAAAAPARALREARWIQADAAAGDGAADVVVVAYVLNELAAEAVAPLARALWGRTQDTALFLEPGTPDGYGRVLSAREAVVADGGFTLGPCPHDRPCPLPAGDWCHFAVRLSRTEAHRAAKRVSRGFEDEKLSYAALTRTRHRRASSRVIRQPQIRSGHVLLDLCETEGLRRATVSRREPAEYRRARKIAWGDAWALDAGAADDPNLSG